MRQFLSDVLFAAVFVFAISIALSAPDRPTPKEQKKSIPDMPTGETNWGELTQQGINFKLENHPIWDGIGLIREDGKISLVWTLRATGEPCPGVYSLDDDGSLKGLWGYSSRVKIEDDGSISGQTYADKTYRLVPSGPDQ